MSVELAYVIFLMAALLVFSKLRAETAVLIVFLGGWLCLPVGHYAAETSQAAFAYWIVGAALPSDLLLTKAWVAPVAALLGALGFDRHRLLRWRPGAADVTMALWCSWPLCQVLFLASSSPSPKPPSWLSSAYLFGTWGATWVLGRVYFSNAASQGLLIQGLMWSVVACLPIAAFEGITGQSIYGFIFEPHPFRFDGSERYLGFRPLGFFENGNQYGLWVSLCALAAVWRALSLQSGRESGRFVSVAKTLAAVGVTVAVAAQSVGALLLAILGGAFLSVGRVIRLRFLVVCLAALMLITSLIYVSGVIPITQIGKGTAFGQSVVNGFRAVGRGSFTWRISQDQKLLPEIKAHILVGTGQWDWWRSKGIRPWGLAMLLLGQFGAIGLSLCFGSVLWPTLREAWRVPRASGWQTSAMPLLLAVIVGLTMLDALMNSFIFFPAVLIAGSLAERRPIPA